MIALSYRKIKYNGSIRKAEIPFEANDSDRELLASWGCIILDGVRKDDIHEDESPKDVPKNEPAEVPKDEPKQEEVEEQPKQAAEPQVKKARRRTKN